MSYVDLLEKVHSTMNVPIMYMFIQGGLILFLVVGFAMLLSTAVVVRDTILIRKHPFKFAAELVLMSILPAIPLLFFVISRNLPMNVALTWFYGLSFKFAVFHILFQLSGFYTYLFENNY